MTEKELCWPCENPKDIGARSLDCNCGSWLAWDGVAPKRSRLGAPVYFQPPVKPYLRFYPDGSYSFHDTFEEAYEPYAMVAKMLAVRLEVEDDD